MQYISRDQTPLGGVLLAADETGLTGLWFEGQKYFAQGLDGEHEERESPLLAQAKAWLAVYFSGREPEFEVPLHLMGTDFQKEVWALLRAIPYGQTTTYGALAARLAAQRGLPHLSPQAVGGAVGHNKVSILVPCHRVVGAHGSLTGYAGGIDKKRALLALEKADMAALFAPKRGPALKRQKKGSGSIGNGCFRTLFFRCQKPEGAPASCGICLPGVLDRGLSG